MSNELETEVTSLLGLSLSSEAEDGSFDPKGEAVFDLKTEGGSMVATVSIDPEDAALIATFAANVILKRLKGDA